MACSSPFSDHDARLRQKKIKAHKNQAMAAAEEEVKASDAGKDKKGELFAQTKRYACPRVPCGSLLISCLITC